MNLLCENPTRAVVCCSNNQIKVGRRLKDVEGAKNQGSFL